MPPEKMRRDEANFLFMNPATSWLFMAAAILFEIAGTTFLKMSNGLNRLWPTVGLAISYAICFFCLSQALKKLDVSVAYAIWSGVGTALVAVIGFIYFRESLNLLKVLSIALIIVGVVGLNLAK